MNNRLMTLFLVLFHLSQVQDLHALSAQEFRALGESLHHKEDFTKQQLEILSKLSLEDEITLFELYGNAADFDLHNIEQRLTAINKNGIAVSDDGKFEAKCYHVPVEAVKTYAIDDDARRILDDFAIRDNNNKVTHYCWFRHPEDNTYHEKIENVLDFFKAPHQLFPMGTGRLTASRTVLITPPNNKPSFFLKASIDTSVFHSEKKMDHEEAIKSFWAAKVAEEVLEFDEKRERANRMLLNVIQLSDTAALAIPAVDLGIAVRPLAKFAARGTFLLPGFSVIHETLGQKLAKLSTADPDHNNPSKYWIRHYARKTGEAVADILASEGLLLYYPHSQNWLVELNRNLVPTGVVVSRDAGDSRVFKPCSHPELTKIWPANEVDKNTIGAYGFIVRFALFWTGGVKKGSPSWAQVPEWRGEYFAAFGHRFDALTGFPESEFDKIDPLMQKAEKDYDSAYVFKMVKETPTNPEFLAWLSFCDCFYGVYDYMRPDDKKQKRERHDCESERLKSNPRALKKTK
jgi:hypothetical protein